MRHRVAGIALLSLGACAPAEPPVEDSMSAARRPVTIAHRGASGYAPEHTFAAWDLALEQGADYLEQDLQMTADGELVVLHDDTLDRTASGPKESCRGPVIERTLAQLRDCDVGSWFNKAHPAHARPAFAAERIATLAAVLERYRGRARFYIETKNPESAPGMEEALVALLRHQGLLPYNEGGAVPQDEADPSALPTVILQSFSAASLRALRALAPTAFLVQLVPGRQPAPATRARLGEIAAYADGIGPRRNRVDAAMVDAAHALGLVVHPYTVNDTREMRRLLDAGVDGMFTDTPDVLRALLDHGR